MASKKKTKQTKPGVQTAIPSIGISLIALGFILEWGLLVFAGFIIGLVWLFRYSKDKPKLRILWWLILAVFVAIELAITVVNIHRYF